MAMIARVHQTRCPGQRHHRNRSQTVLVKCSPSEYNTKVRGDVKRVSWYVSNFANLSDWYPGVRKSCRADESGDNRLMVGHQFRVNFSISNVDSQILYELVEFELGKRAVLLGSNEYHKAREEFVFMPDPNDPGMTYVSYKSAIQLRGWMGGVSHLARGLLSKQAEMALNGLSELLNGPNSPLPVIRKEDVQDRSASTSQAWSQGFGNVLNGIGGRLFAAAAASSNSRAGARPAGDKSATQKTATSAGARPAEDNGVKSSARAGPDVKDKGTYSTPSSVISTNGPMPDPLGFYQALDLTPPPTVLFMSVSLSSDEIKQAYRKAAQVCHPDKFINATPEDQEAAATRFHQVQQAYEVLRDPDRRSAYDKGNLQRATASPV